MVSFSEMCVFNIKYIQKSSDGSPWTHCTCLNYPLLFPSSYLPGSRGAGGGGGSGKCTDLDVSGNCGYWRGQGYCNSGSSHANWMKINCCATCSI